MKSVLDFANNIVSNNNLILANLKYCFVDCNKRPFRYDNQPACPNKKEDFVSIFDLLGDGDFTQYKGLGVSVQASDICAIDVDHCFDKPFDIDSGNNKAKYIIDLFSKNAYIEFSFSGTGLRILFRNEIIDNYELKYYIKNSKEGIEFYQPSNSFRYVTITGCCIYSNPIVQIDSNILEVFLNKYMKRNLKTVIRDVNDYNEERSFDQLMIVVKKLYLKNYEFQNLWFSKAPGSGKDESERDYWLCEQIYLNVTKDVSFIKQIFESSPFYKSKDYKHKFKWDKSDNKYFYYITDKIKRGY